MTDCMPKIRTKVQFFIGDKQAEFYTFDGLRGDKGEHFAIKLGPHNDTPIIRIHSECITGDVFRSRRCDCGEQLEEALEIAHKEGGIVLYLR